MLYLRTGGNGSCKSLFTLRDVRDLQLKSGRPVCVIVGDEQDPARQFVKIKPEIMAEFEWSTCQFKDWFDQVDGTIFLADECHNYMPKRSPSAAVPKPIKLLAEHRARGFDFFMLTQHPMNIDEFVRRLVQAPGWHQHLKRVFGGTNVTRVLQWDAVNPQCEKNGSGKTAEITTRQQPREVYKWYDSATLHTAKVRIPKQFIMLAACLVIVPALGYVAFQMLMPKSGQAASKGSGQAGADLSLGAPAGGGASERKPMTTAEYVVSYQPRIAGLMHTAPAYDRLTEPKRVPVPAACVESKAKGCKCYTQDATPYPVDLAMCRQLVAHGAFLAFQAEGERADRQAAPQQPHQAQQTGPQQPPALISMDALPQAAPAAPAPAEPVPQRIASVRR